MSLAETLVPTPPPPRATLGDTTRPALAEIAVITSAADLAAIAEPWGDLETRAPGATLFQSLGWARAIFDFEAARNNADFTPAIAILRRRGRLVPVLPLERVKTRLRSALVPLGGAFAQYADILLDPAEAPGPVVAALLGAARIAAPADMISLLKVRADSMLAAGLPPSALKTGAESGAPYVELTGYPDFESYLRTIKPKTRKNLRNTRNRLARVAALSHHVAGEADAQRGVIARTLAGRAKRLKTQGLTSRAFADPDFAIFCQSLAGRQDIELLAMSLRLDDAPLAEQWGFVHRGRYYAYVATRDFDQSEESPGRLHLGHVLETAFARGLDTADLLAPVMPYKLTWSSGVTPIADYAIAASPRGRLAIHLWDRALRPLLKRVVLALPPALRAQIIGLMGGRNG